MEPSPLAVPAKDSPLRAAWRAVWARRWKLLGVAAVYVLGRSCPLWPAWATPACELLHRLARAFP